MCQPRNAIMSNFLKIQMNIMGITALQTFCNVGKKCFRVAHIAKIDLFTCKKGKTTLALCVLGSITGI